MNRYIDPNSIVEAIQFTGFNFQEIKEFCPDARKIEVEGGFNMIIGKRSSAFEIHPNMFLYKKSDGQFYCYPDDMFHLNFIPLDGRLISPGIKLPKPPKDPDVIRKG